MSISTISTRPPSVDDLSIQRQTQIPEADTNTYNLTTSRTKQTQNNNCGWLDTMVSRKAKELWPTYVANLKPSDVHGYWGVGKYRAMHGDGKSSAGGYLKGWLMKGKDGKFHFQIKEKTGSVEVIKKVWDEEPSFDVIVAWIRNVKL